MFNTWPLLKDIPFPAIRRGRLDTLQINIGYRCNQYCVHCHVGAGPHRREQMNAQTIDLVLAVLEARAIGILDITGGAPELNPHFRRLVRAARQLGVRVLDRCNLTVLELPDQSDLAEFLKSNAVEIMASMPCYLKDNVDRQRGRGVFETSIRVLRRLNALGYGSQTGLVLNLVYNPQGPSLPPPQAELEAGYRRVLGGRYGIVFNQLYTLANMPIQRFGALLTRNNKMETYLALLRTSHRHDNLEKVMCRSLISVDWCGYLYDCDFNQMLGLPVAWGDRPHLSDLLKSDVSGNLIRVAGHCFGCTAGQGSSCGGALQAHAASETPAHARQDRTIDKGLEAVE
jgi:radical SAM/Cys-rich protein